MSIPARRLVLATGNAGKAREIGALLAPAGVEILPQSAFGLDSAAETGATFVENAILKARHAAAGSGLPAIADDSGLVVDALGGAPGIHSARYAGVSGDAGDAANVQKLLAALAATPGAPRSARFVCVAVLLRHPDDPLPLDALKSFDASLDYKAARVLLRNGEMTDLSATLSLAKGDLNLKPLVLTAFGGKIEQNLRLNASAQTPQLAVEGKVEKLDLGALLKAAADSDMLSANTDASWQLAGRGASPRAIAASLDGQVRTILQGGTVNNKYFELIAADLVPKLLPGNTAQEANLNCIVTRIDIAKGVATNRVMLLDTSRITIVGTGTANLGTEQLDMKLTPSPKDKSLLSLATPILIRGSFAKPSFSPDPVALATGVAGAVAGTMVNPLGLLVPFLSAGSSESPCAQAIASLDNPDAARSGGSGGTPQQQDQQQPGSIPGLFKNLLGR